MLLSTIAAAPDFATQVRPVLERSCMPCHGQDKQKSGFRLDVREAAYRGGSSGQPAIVAHDAEASPLYRYISGADLDMQMPPPDSGVPPLSAEEVLLIREWINAGPPWPDELAGNEGLQETHWSLKPLASPPVPGEQADPIDAFIQATLSEKGLSPSPEADRRTLIRRLYNDLVGLPPAPEVVAEFIADDSPDAYERLVDKLLASPQYGERWARHWLDTIHYADTHGYEHDLARDNAWPYRDYLIAALNNDTPWPRFIREQLAADYFYPEESQLVPALGFLGAGTFDLSTFTTTLHTFDYLARDDLVTQTMSAFTSTTANCARCHAHKFDPIPQEDYYALQAVFAGIIKGDIGYDQDPAVAAERKYWRDLLSAADNNLTDKLVTPETNAMVAKWMEQHGGRQHWVALQVTEATGGGSTLTVQPDGSVTAGGERPDKETYTLTGSLPTGEFTGFRLECLAHDSLPSRGPGRSDSGVFQLSEFELKLVTPEAPDGTPVKLRRASDDFHAPNAPADKAIDGSGGTAWSIEGGAGADHHAVYELESKLSVPEGAKLAITLKHESGGAAMIGALRLSVTSDAPEQAAARTAEVEQALRVVESRRTPEQQATITAHVLRGFVAHDALAKLPPQSRVYAAAKQVEIPAGDPPFMPHGTGIKDVHLLERGDFFKPLQKVEPGALSAIEGLPARFALQDIQHEAERRAALADWIAHKDNVLTWRSIVNRVWQYHFGRGLCDTPSDLGKMGGAPSHPELIDWLAVWFRDEAAGSLKQLHRLIVTSETWKQSSELREECTAVDGDNRLLWRQNRQRMDADAIRDAILAVSGTLDLAMGGPGIQQFTQGKGPQITPALDYNAYQWDSPGAGRRSIYTFVWRGMISPYMESLDFPDLGLLAPTRGFSASSLQALTLMNDDFMLYHSAAFARRLADERAELSEQVSRAVELAWLRPPTDFEKADYTRFSSEHGLPSLCRVLLNSNPFLFVE